jgi:hypothetical protein
MEVTYLLDAIGIQSGKEVQELPGIKFKEVIVRFEQICQSLTVTIKNLPMIANG